MSNEKKKHSSTDVLLPASAILFRKLRRLFHSIFGRDDRASKSGRRPIEHTGIVLPIPAALPLAQTNRLIVLSWGDKYRFNPFPDDKNLTLSKLKAFAEDKINVI